MARVENCVPLSRERTMRSAGTYGIECAFDVTDIPPEARSSASRSTLEETDFGRTAAETR
jgi:hypothetical protein